MADKKLVLSPKQTDQVIIYKVENGLRVTPEERARYEKIKNRPAADKKAAPRKTVQMTSDIQDGNKTAALDAAQKQMLYDKGVADKKAAQYTEQMQKGRAADAVSPTPLYNGKSSAPRKIVQMLSDIQDGNKTAALDAAQKQMLYDKGAADKKAAQYTEQMQKGRAADADTAQQYYESKNKIRNINPTADAVTIKQVEPKTASKFDIYLANVQMLRAQRAKLLQNRGKMPPAEFDKQLAYIDDAIERIRRTAQDEGVYAYATERGIFAPDVYRDYAYLIGHDDAYDLTAFDYMEPKSSPYIRYEDHYPRGLQVYDAQRMYNKMDPVKAAGTYIKALWAEYNAANSFNKVFTASGYPEGYDFSNDKTPFGKQLRKAYDNYIKNKDAFEIATVAVKQKLAASDDTYVNQFLKSFYERCKSEIALSPEDESYVEEVLRSLDPTAYDESTHATSNKQIMSDYDQAKREMEGA